MLGLNIVCFGTLKEKYLKDACLEYGKRLGGYVRLRIFEFDEGENQKAKSCIPQKSYKIALCIEGTQLSSEELACLIEKKAPVSPELTFVIGGSDGLPEELTALCDMRLSFSKMTFPHQLMRVILLEQLYRSMTIINNGKYHK